MVSVDLVLYVMLGAIIGMIYSLRRVIILEHRIIDMEQRIVKLDKNIITLLKRKK